MFFILFKKNNIYSGEIDHDLVKEELIKILEIQ